MTKLKKKVSRPASKPVAKPPLTSGVKYDENKLRFDLFSPAANSGLAAVLTYGAQKYEARNWERGLDYGRVYAALQRHLNLWWSGEQDDDESGLSHLDHAACCIHFLSHFEKHETGTDDRPCGCDEE